MQEEEIVLQFGQLSLASTDYLGWGGRHTDPGVESDESYLETVPRLRLRGVSIGPPPRYIPISFIQSG